MLRFPALMLLLACTSVFGADTVVVRKIDIRGLKSTRAWVVERELYFSVGDTITHEDMDAAHKRLHNLQVFNDAELSADSAGIVVVELAEAWPILPALSLSFPDNGLTNVLKDPRTFWENTTIVAGVRHLNFRHNAEQLYAFTQLGSTNGFFVGYSTRWLSPRQPVTLRARVQYLTVNDRHASVLDSSRTMRDDGLGVDVGSRGGSRERLGLGLAYQHVRREDEWPAEGGKFDLLRVTPSIGLDYRDLEWWPSRGGVAEAAANFNFGTVDFIRSQYGLRGYIPLRSYFSSAFPHRPPVLALRIGAATSTSNTPSFAHYYHGFEQGFRGYRTVKTESSSFLLASAELRFPITVEATYNVPLIGRWGRRWPLGMAGVAFVERGELQLDNTRTPLLGYGAGIYLRVPYAQIVELALALNRDGDHEFTLRLGISY